MKIGVPVKVSGNTGEGIHMARTHRRDRVPVRILGASAIVALGLSLAACGGAAPQSTEQPAATSAAASAAASAAPSAAPSQAAGPRVGIFVDNAFGDGDFFDQAAKAQSQLVDTYGATVTTYEGQLQAQNFGPLLQDAADNNDIVYVLGFEAIDAMLKAAADNPNTTFVFIDAVIDSPDVVSAEFKTAEGCFMAGALAATVNQDKGSKVAGFIGGVDAPVIKNCESGYTQGVAAVDPAQKVAAQYAGSFVDPAKGSEISIALANKGAFSVFPYAGLTGAGAFDAAKGGADVAPIGVVADKSSLAPGKSPGSLEMGVDAVIMESTGKFIEGNLPKGSVESYGFANGGWHMVYNSDFVSTEQQDALNALQGQLESGEITLK